MCKRTDFSQYFLRHFIPSNLRLSMQGEAIEHPLSFMLSQGYQKTKLVATLKKFYGRHHDLVNPYNVAVSRIVSDVFASDAP